MHFSAFVLALLPAAVRSLTLYPTFECLPDPGTTVGCVGTCLPFSGNHSFRNNDVVVQTFVQTYETDDCTSSATVPPVNFTAPPRSCVAAITGKGIGSFKCQLSPFV